MGLLAVSWPQILSEYPSLNSKIVNNGKDYSLSGDPSDIIPSIFMSSLTELRRFMFYYYFLQSVARPKSCTIHEACLKYDR